MHDVLNDIAIAFGSAPRPEHFTNYQHCRECAEHDAVLVQHTPDTIGLAELGNPGWDPMCFAATAGYMYYMPALARLALGRGRESYLDQFLFHLTDERKAAFTHEQRLAVLHLLDHIYETMRDELTLCLDRQLLENAIVDLMEELGL